MIIVTAKSDDCPGDNCPTLADDTTTGDVLVQMYVLPQDKATEADSVMGPLPDGEVRGYIPAQAFDQLMAQRSAAGR